MTASARRLVVYYAILAVVTIVVVVVVFAAGSDEETQPAIAGGYDVAAPAAGCTGLQMDVSQSGQFVDLRRPDGTALSHARLRDGRLKGDVRCIGGRSRHRKPGLRRPREPRRSRRSERQLPDPQGSHTSR